jgi:hypothetical protein
MVLKKLKIPRQIIKIVKLFGLDLVIRYCQVFIRRFVLLKKKKSKKIDFEIFFF